MRPQALPQAGSRGCPLPCGLSPDPPSHLHCHHPFSPGLCPLGQPEKIWKISLVGKLVQPRGMLRLSPYSDTVGAVAEEGAFNTKGRVFLSIAQLKVSRKRSERLQLQ